MFSTTLDNHCTICMPTERDCRRRGSSQKEKKTLYQLDVYEQNILYAKAHIGTESSFLLIVSTYHIVNGFLLVHGFIDVKIRPEH